MVQLRLPVAFHVRQRPHPVMFLVKQRDIRHPLLSGTFLCAPGGPAGMRAERLAGSHEVL